MVETPSLENAISVGPTAASGATIRANYVERNVTYYAVERKEITLLSSLNSQTLAFSSTGSFVLSLGIGLAVNRIFADKLSPSGEVLSTVGAGTLIGVSLVFFGLALSAYRTRKTELQEILGSAATTTTVKVQTGAE